MPKVTHHGRSTSFGYTSGSDPTLCCVHGSGGTRAVWKAQRSRLDYGVAAVDLAGHGTTADVNSDPGQETLKHYVEDCVAVAKSVDADILMGNSLGGLVVLETILSTLNSVDGVILVGSGAKLSVTESLRSQLATDWESAIDSLHAPGRLFADPSQKLESLSRSGMRDVGQAVTERDFLTCHRMDFRDRLDGITMPLLAFTGVADELTPPFFHRYLAQETPHGRTALVPGAAHLSMLEQPDLVNHLLRDFLEGLPK